jgi:Kef-type K+ transport system membrane component KefB
VDLARSLDSLAVIALVAALAPLVVALLPGPRLPQVVFLLVGGALVGPQVLGWAEVASLQVFVDVGLGFLFLLAGYELDLRLFGQRPGRFAIAGWVVSVVLAAGVVGVLALLGLVRDVVPVSLALTTTALGTLLPILRDNDMLVGRFGRYVLAAGAVGELFPVLAIALFLSTSNRFVALLSLLAVAVLALALAYLPRFVPGRRLARIVREGQDATAQTTLRFTVLLLLVLLAVTDTFGIDVVLGAFAAGMVLRRWAPGDVESLERKLDAVGYGFFIPVFFVASGMNLDLRSIAESPLRLVLFFLLLLAVRGLPSLLLYRTELSARRRTELALLTATALPLLVALTEIGLRTGTMRRENAAALVGAGALSVLVYPALAVALHRRAPREAPPDDRAPRGGGAGDGEPTG